MISHRVSGWLIIALNACILFGSCTAEAQDSDPFELAHPQTGEKGMWSPDWLVREHLRTETDLKTCIEKTGKQQELIGKRDAELEHRRAALDDEKQASKAVQESLAVTSVQLQEEQGDNAVLTRWLYATTAGTVVAVAVIVLREVL